MSDRKDRTHKNLIDHIQAALRGLTHCLEGYLSTLRSVSNRP